MTTRNLGDGITQPVDGIDSGKEIKEDKAFLAVKAEKKALAEKLAIAQAELERFNAEAKTKQEESLKQQGEYKKLWEEGQKSNAELAEKLKAKEKKELTLRKIDVVMQELGGPLLKPEYWNFVDVDSIPVDESTGDIDLNIAKQKVLDFSNKYPELMPKKNIKLPGNAASAGKQITKEEWKKLPLAEKRTRLKDVKK